MSYSDRASGLATSKRFQMANNVSSIHQVTFSRRGLPLVKFSLIVLILTLATLMHGDTFLDSKPISVSMGNFFVGQEPYPMYVEYFAPARQTHQIPIVLIHGGATTGAVYL